MTNEEHVEEMLKTAMDNNLPRNDTWIICIMSITNSLAVIADELEALRKGKEGSDNWISVTERLPDAGDTYIVNIEYKGKFEGVDIAEFVFTDDGYIDGKWNTWNDWIEGNSTDYHVTAWMQLPEPYKKGSD